MYEIRVYNKQGIIVNHNYTWDLLTAWEMIARYEDADILANHVIVRSRRDGEWMQ